MSDTATDLMRTLLRRFFDPDYVSPVFEQDENNDPIIDPSTIGGQWLGIPRLYIYNGNPSVDGDDVRGAAHLAIAVISTPLGFEQYGWNPFAVVQKGSINDLTNKNSQITSWILNVDIPIENETVLEHVTHIQYVRGSQALLTFTLDKPTDFKPFFILRAGSLRFTMRNGFDGFRLLVNDILNGIYPDHPTETPFFRFHHATVRSDMPYYDIDEYLVGENIDMEHANDNRLCNAEVLSCTACENTRTAYKRTLLGLLMLYNRAADPDPDIEEYVETLCAYAPFKKPLEFVEFSDYTFDVGKISLVVR